MQWMVWLHTSGDIVFTLGAIAIVLFTVRAIYAIFQSGNSPAGTPAKEER